MPAMPTRHHYGPHLDQYFDVCAPPGLTRGTLVLIHGGYWREQFSAALMRPLVPDFLAAGWQVVNMEYRRGAHGWPATREDLDLALAAARGRHTRGKMALIGHSVGGQLALLAAAAEEQVVALAPVTDLARSYHERLGEDAVQEYFKASPDEAPGLYCEASPLVQVPPAGELLLIHGHDDERVPIAHTRDYLRALKAAGGKAVLWEIPSLPHRRMIAPDAGIWPQVRAWLGQDEGG